MYYSICNIQRKKVIEHGRFTSTGKFEITGTEIVIEPHGTPLFTEAETTTGICKSCREGWEVEGSLFASQAERERATKVKP